MEYHLLTLNLDKAVDTVRGNCSFFGEITDKPEFTFIFNYLELTPSAVVKDIEQSLRYAMAFIGPLDYCGRPCMKGSYYTPLT